MIEALTLRMINVVELPSWRHLLAWLRALMTKPATLAEELAALGVSTIDLDRVRRFQAMMVLRERVQGRAGAKWDSRGYTAFRGEIPDGARRVGDCASTIPNAQVVVETFDRDPFMKVLRSAPRSKWFSFLGSRSEEAYIACWDTVGFYPNE